MSQAESKQSFGFEEVSLKLPVKLVIYDFDQTISSEHLFYTLDGAQEDALAKMSDDRLTRVFGGEQRMERLTQHLARVSSCCELAILSFGWEGVIRNALQRMKLLPFFSGSEIIGKDSEALKVTGSKAKCIYQMKKKRKLKSTQIMFVDDDNANIQKATSYAQTVLISPRKGMHADHMKSIEQACGAYPSSNTSKGSDGLFMELTTPKTVSKQISKHYPSTQQQHTHNVGSPRKQNELAKYQIKSVPKWFDKLSNPDADAPVIQIGGDQTPGSESGEYELNVPMLATQLADVAMKPRNGLSLNDITSEDSSQYEEDASEDNE